MAIYINNIKNVYIAKQLLLHAILPITNIQMTAVRKEQLIAIMGMQMFKPALQIKLVSSHFYFTTVWEAGCHISPKYIEYYCPRQRAGRQKDNPFLKDSQAVFCTLAVESIWNAYENKMSNLPAVSAGMMVNLLCN